MKKITNKEIQSRLDILLRQLIVTQNHFENLQKVFAMYVNYKGESDSFKEYLEKEGEKDGTHKPTTGKKSSKGNENNDRGKQNTKKKSKKSSRKDK